MVDRLSSIIEHWTSIIDPIDAIFKVMQDSKDAGFKCYVEKKNTNRVVCKQGSLYTFFRTFNPY
jgi:hypothetical protein